MPTRTHDGTEYEISPAHPAAEDYPWMTDAQLSELAANIKTNNGLEHSVVRLKDGRIADGRNRELGCKIANITPTYVTRDWNDEEVYEFVEIQNLHRRDLTPSQRAAVVVARNKRLGKGGDRRSEDFKPQRCGLKTQAELAEIADVSERTIHDAAKVANEAPELLPAIRDGQLDAHTAAKAADLPKADRKKIVEAEDPKKEAKKRIKKKKAKAAEQKPEEPTSEPAADPAEAFVNSVETLCREIDQIAARMKKLKESPLAYCIHIDSAVSQVEAARKTLWIGRPAHKCSYCKGEGCKACHQTGRVKKSSHESGNKAVGGAA